MTGKPEFRVVRPETSTAGRSALYGYAVLRTNFNHAAPSYLDNFLAFVVDVLATHQPAGASSRAVGQGLRDNFGLTVPDQAAEVLLRRAVKSGQAIRVGRDLYALAPGTPPAASLVESIAQFRQKQDTLRARFLDFVATQHRETLSVVEDDPDRHLHKFIERHAVPLLSRAVRGARGDQPDWSDLKGADYLIAAFILQLVQTDATTFGYVVDAVKGAILTSVLDLGVSDLRRSLKDLTFVLDTPVLLNLLGYQGEAPQQAAQQTIDLAHRLGAKTICFEHTEQEIGGILDAVMYGIRGAKSASVALGPVANHFIRNGSTPAHLLLEKRNLRDRLQQLSIRVAPRPDDYYKYGLDETALDELLTVHMPTQKEATRRFDVQTLSAVHRLRRGESPDSLERCGSVVMTNNRSLCRAARKVDERHRWPLAMLDSELAALLWVRGPAAADDLPRQQLLATAYEGMQPGSHLWNRYIEEIERLEADGQVSEDEALVFRTQTEVGTALMDITLGEADFDTETVREVVARVRESYQAPLRAQVDQRQAEREAAERTAAEATRAAEASSQAEQLAEQRAEQGAREQQRMAEELTGVRATLASDQERRTKRDARISDEAARRAKRTVVGTALVLGLLLLALPALQVASPDLLHQMPRWIVYATGSSAVVLFIATGMRLVVGGSVKEWLKPLERPLAARYEQRARRRLLDE